MNGASESEIARKLRLRGPLPNPVRLSRRILTALAAVAGLALAGVIAWSLAPRARHRTDESAPALAAAAPPAGLARLPADYSAALKPPPPPADAPKLGPPLPGDLGRPILDSGAVGGDRAGANLRAGSVDQAAASGIFAASAVPAATRSAEPATLSASPITAGTPLDELQASDQQAQFVSTPGSALPGRLQAPVSPYVLLAGTVVPAVLVTGIRSDAPGPVMAQVSEDVYDSVHGRFLLIPRGARLLGTYDAQVRFGQQRLLVVWTRLVLPDGRALDLGREPAGDPQGYAGLSDQIDRKWGGIGGAAAVSTLLSLGAQLGAGSQESQLVQALRNGAAGGVNQAGQQLVGKSLEVQPTLTIRQGFPVRLLLTHDLALAPWATDG